LLGFLKIEGGISIPFASIPKRCRAIENTKTSVCVWDIIFIVIEGVNVSTLSAFR